MNVPLLIARRYFSSKKKRNIISIISNISMIGVAVGTMSLIIVLSVFNGLEDLVRTLYGKSDPDLLITAVEGKSFEVNAPLLNHLRTAPGVNLVTEVIEDNALLQYHDRQMVVKMKGVTGNYFAQTNIDSAIVEGDHRLRRGGEAYALIGAGVQHELSIALDNRFSPLRLLYPRNTGKRTLSLNPENAFSEQSILAGGVFLIEQQIDNSYIFVPLDFAQELLNYGSRRTSLEIRVSDGFSIETTQADIQRLIGPKFRVLNSDEQHISLLKAIKVEKMFVFITFAFILLIASLNIFFSLSMLVIDKRKDIAMLMAMGATKPHRAQRVSARRRHRGLCGGHCRPGSGYGDLLAAANIWLGFDGDGDQRGRLLPGQNAIVRHRSDQHRHHYYHHCRVYSASFERVAHRCARKSVTPERRREYANNNPAVVLLQRGYNLHLP